MTTIYLIRHAEAEGNLYRIAQGQADSLLTQRGQRQVQALARRFRDIPVDAVYASDLTRTCATAAAVCCPKGLPLRRRRDLREICVGAWEHMPWGQIAKDDPAQLENFTRRLHLWRVEGAETPRQVQARMLSAVREIAAENDGRTAAVFSHGCAIRLVLAAIQGIPLEELGRTPTGANTAVSCLRAEGGALEVVYRDDAGHLEDPARIGGHGAEKRPSGLEPGLYFEPLRAEDAPLLQWLGRAPELPAGSALLGGRRLDGRLVGAVAFDDALQARSGQGSVPLLTVAPDWRRRGYGVQLLGQAVMHFRPLGRGFVLLPPPGPGEADFYRDNGFIRPKDGAAGPWKKDIRRPAVPGDGEDA